MLSMIFISGITDWNSINHMLLHDDKTFLIRFSSNMLNPLFHTYQLNSKD